MYVFSKLLNTNNGDKMKKIGFFLLFVFTIALLKLFFLTIIDNQEYKDKLLQKTNITVLGYSAPRGRILDIHGNVLVDNKGVNTIIYSKYNTTVEEEIEIAYILAKNISSVEEGTTLELKKFWLANNGDGKELILEKEYRLYNERKLNLMDLNKLKTERITEEILASYDSLDKKAAHVYALMNKGYSYDKKVISNKITDQEFANLLEMNIKGVTGELSWERQYNYKDTLQNIFGTIGPINLENKEKYLNEGYALTDIVGLSNLEYQYDSYLQGKKAKYLLKEDGTLSLIEESEKGNDLYLSIDIKMQEELNKILEENIIKGKKIGNTEYYNGSYVVVVDAKNGAIKAMTGKRILGNSKEEIFSDTSLNILNSSFTVGSVVKGASMTVGYKYNLIDVGKKIKDSCVKLYLNPAKCSYKSLGYIDDITALKTSSNYYQFLLAIKSTGNTYKYNMKLDVTEENFDTYRDVFASYGLGNLTGIDLPNEPTGLKGKKIAGDLLLNLSIGQYDTYTILEVAQYMNTIANDGKRYKLSLMDHIENDKEEIILKNDPVVLNQVELEKEYYDRIKEGLRQVLFLGTGYGYTDTKYKPAGKTGTSESFYDYDNDGVNDVKTITSTYAMFAPYDDPKYTIVVVSPNVSHYSGKTSTMAYINRYISKDVTQYIFENY